jgi:heme-degrading monooxygenase HmoA
MIVRLWRATVRVGQELMYDAFARDVSQPMFEQQDGFRGVLFSRSSERCLVITLWADQASVERLAASPRYQETVKRISALIQPETTTEVYEALGGSLTGTFQVD